MAKVRIKDIAGKLKINASTVSRVLSGRGEECRISKDTIQRVEMEAKRLGYRPNMYARFLRTRRTMTIGLLVTDMSNAFFAEVASAIEDVARKRDYSTVIVASGEQPEREEEYLSLVSSRPVDGLIVVPAAGAGVAERLKDLHSKDVPIVLIDRAIRGLGCDQILFDNRKAMREIVTELAAFGCRRIGYVSGPSGIWTASERFLGFKQGMKKAGLAIDPSLVRETSYSMNGGRIEGLALFEQKTKPDALIAANGKIMIGALSAMAAVGKVAKNVIAAAVDRIPLADALDRPLLIMEQDTLNMGRLAAGRLIDRIEGKVIASEWIKLPVTLTRFRI